MQWLETVFSGSVNWHMWFVLALTAWAAWSYVRERLSIEVTSVILLTALLLFGQFFPYEDANGRNQLDSMALLSGFANPALVAVLALLVMGQGIVQTDALRPLINLFLRAKGAMVWVAILTILVLVMVLSAFMNNTPLVVLAIPVLQALALGAGISESKVMIPLSFVAILGGMTTLVGSSTNLLVASSMLELGYTPLAFFDFIVPGSILAAVGFVYVVLLVPRLLPDRSSMAQELIGDKKEFVAELDISADSDLVGEECEGGEFTALPNVNVRLIQRAGHLILPPFEGYRIEAGDIMIIAATRDNLAQMLASHPGYLLSEEQRLVLQPHEAEAVEGEERKGPRELEERVAETRVVAELMIAPGSRLVDMTLEQVAFGPRYRVIVLGVQRRARVVRRRLGRIRLEAGDVLLITGSHGDVEALQGNQDFVLLSGSKKELPLRKKAPVAAGIMLGAIALAAVGILSIPVAAIAGSILMIATGCLNIRQATRAVDRKIFLLVGSMLALGTALQATNGANYIADSLLQLPFFETPLMVASALFIIIAILTNILSNNACAILFTPIAMNMAVNMGIDPTIFAIAVVFAANCSFASPIGYKTNLLVMGPGHYRFKDFIKSGGPLIFILWFVYIGIAKFYFGL